MNKSQKIMSQIIEMYDENIQKTTDLDSKGTNLNL